MDILKQLTKVCGTMCPFILLLSLLLGYFDLTLGSYAKSTFAKANDVVDILVPEPLAGCISHANLTFDPQKLEAIYENEEKVVDFNVTMPCCNIGNITVSIRPDDSVIAEVSKNSSLELTLESIGGLDPVASGSFAIRGKRLGKTTLLFSVTNRSADPQEPGSCVVGPGYSVIVIRKRRVVDDIFRYGLIALACILYIGFGCKIDLGIIWTILKRPISPAIGFGCQFILMPLLGFGISRMLSLSNELSFGLLAMASSPGGGSSNVWVNLLGGDLDLSLTMTTISTFGSLAMMPFWMFVLGRMLIDRGRVSIPYMTLFRSLLTIIVPCLAGLIIKKLFPKVAEKIAKFTRPFSGIFVIYILSFGTYVNLYMYIIMGTVPKVIVSAILLPLCGYLLAFVLALLLKRTKKSAVAIAIETGVQNASIPIIMLQGNFPQPEGDLGAVMPVATSLFTQFPIMFAWIGVLIYRRVKGKPEEDQEMGVEADEITSVSAAVEAKEPKPDGAENTAISNGSVPNGLPHLQDAGLTEKGHTVSKL